MSNQLPIPNMAEEKDALEYAVLLVDRYKAMEGRLRKEYDELVKLKEGFPIKFLKDIEFEDLVLQASSAKFRSALVARQLNGLTSEANYELDFLIASFKLNIADQALEDKGFEKVTEGLRDAYVNSKVELKVLGQLVSRVKILAESAEKLIRIFDGDEINFRRLLERSTNHMGFK